MDAAQTFVFTGGENGKRKLFVGMVFLFGFLNSFDVVLPGVRFVGMATAVAVNWRIWVGEIGFIRQRRITLL